VGLVASRHRRRHGRATASINPFPVGIVEDTAPRPANRQLVLLNEMGWSSRHLELTELVELHE